VITLSKNRIKQSDIRKKLKNIVYDLNYNLEPLFKIDYKKLENIKILLISLEKYIFDLEKISSDYSLETSINNIFLSEEKINLVGVLPALLLSKKIIKSNNELIFFSNDILNLNIDIPSKRPRNYIVGHILEKFLENKNINYDIINQKINNYIINKPREEKLSFFEEWDLVIGRNKNNVKERKNPY